MEIGHVKSLVRNAQTRTVREQKQNLKKRKRNEASFTDKITPTTERIVKWMTPNSKRMCFEGIEHDNRKLDQADKEQEIRDKTWVEDLSPQAIGLWIEQWFVASFSCPRCLGQLALFKNCMPIYDCLCIKCDQLWQIKTTTNSQYHCKKTRTITISPVGLNVHTISVDDDNSFLIPGYICIYLDKNGDHYRVNTSKSFSVCVTESKENVNSSAYTIHGVHPIYKKPIIQFGSDCTVKPIHYPKLLDFSTQFVQSL